MSDPTPSRRFALLITLIAAFAITNCSTTGPSLFPPKEKRCTKGNGSPSRPIICVDDTGPTLTASPNTAQVYDYEAVNRLKSDRPVVVHWFTQRTGNLGIEFTDKSCVERVHCDGTGHCSAKVKPLDGVKLRQCSYTLNLDGKTSDPDIVINPCCW